MSAAPTATTTAVTPAHAGRRQFLAAAGTLVFGAHSQGAEPAAPPVKVALIAPLTGPLKAFGLSADYVFKQAAQRLRAGFDTTAGHRRIELTLHDSASSARQASDIATALVAAAVDMVLVTGTPDTTNPVADVCEQAGVPCLSTVAPWQAWLFGRKGEAAKGFRWTFHFFSGTEDFADVYACLFARSGIPGPIGGLFGDDPDGHAFMSAFPSAMAKRSLKLLDPGRVDLESPDFAPLVRKLQEAQVQIVTGNLPPPVALQFFKTAHQMGYQPKMASIGKAFIFPDTVAQVVKAVAQRPLAVTNEVWWSPAWPFKSAFFDTTAAQLCADYERTTSSPWTQPLGFSQALVDVLVECVRIAPKPDRDGLRDALTRVRASTVVGVINFKSRYPSLSVCTTPAVGGQWVRRADGTLSLEVVENSRSPFIPVTSALRVSSVHA